MASPSRSMPSQANSIFMSLYPSTSVKLMRNPVYYLSTDEGLLSHFRQLDILWNAVRPFNRTIIAMAFNSSQHYPDVSQVSLCDIFRLPNEIVCSKLSPDYVFNTRKCVFTGLFHNSVRYFRRKMVPMKNFSYETSECIAGGINTDVGFPLISQRKSMMKYPIFSSKYQTWLPLVYKALGMSDQSIYVVAHWRRGDQISIRCLNVTKSSSSNMTLGIERRDTSVNCETPEELVNQLNQDMKNHIYANQKASIPTLTYIATNEKDAKMLSYLKMKGMKTFDDVRRGLRRVGLQLSPLDEFVVELMLMCDATYLFAWGESTAHNFLYHCRMIDETKKHVTIMDDPGSLGHGHHINNYGKRKRIHSHERYV